MCTELSRGISNFVIQAFIEDVENCPISQCQQILKKMDLHPYSKQDQNLITASLCHDQCHLKNVIKSVVNFWSYLPYRQTDSQTIKKSRNHSKQEQRAEDLIASKCSADCDWRLTVVMIGADWLKFAVSLSWMMNQWCSQTCCDSWPAD